MQKDTKKVTFQHCPTKIVNDSNKSSLVYNQDIDDDDDDDDEEEEDFDLEKVLNCIKEDTEIHLPGLPDQYLLRRLRSKHRRSEDNLWLPGNTTPTSSFNSKCSNKYSWRKDSSDRRFNEFYYSLKNNSTKS